MLSQLRMAKQWIRLPAHWSLENVQAVLNVIVSVLSALAIWMTTRTFWRRGSVPLIKARNVQVISLLTISSLGEVFDVIKTFRFNLSVRYLAIWAQCIAVIIFSLSGILSGPIARFSSRRGTETRQISLTGLLPITTQEGGQEKIVSALVQWNETQKSLIRAGFPTDQLLDFLPGTSKHWLYRKNEWNSSWSARCNFIPATPIDLVSTGNRSDTLLYTQVPGLKDLTPERFHNKSVYLGRYQLAAFEENRDTYRDALLFVLRYPDGWTSANRDWDRQMSVSILCVYMHNAPRPSDMDGDVVSFGKGKIGRASFTRVDCDLTRINTMPDGLQFAYPHTLDPDSIVQVYADYYRPNLVQKSIANLTISPPTPEELFQFYQVYLVTKDTQLQNPVERILTAETPTIELSVILLALVLFVFCVVVVGMCWYIPFLYRYRSRLDSIPDSKLDWMALSIKEAEGRFSMVENGSGTGAEGLDILKETQPTTAGAERTNYQRLRLAKYGPSQLSCGLPGPLKIHPI